MKLVRKQRRIKLINITKLFVVWLIVLFIIYISMLTVYYRDKYYALRRHVEIVKAQLEQRTVKDYAYLVDYSNSSIEELATYVRELAYEVYKNRRPIALYIANLIVSNEGQYSNHPLDPGGETFYGFSTRYNDFVPKSKQEAVEYIVRNYYYAQQLDKLNSIRLAYAICDSMFLFGDEFVKSKLKTLLDVKTYDEVINRIKDYTDIDDRTDKLINSLRSVLIERVNELVQRNRQLTVFEKGWKNRIRQYR